MRNILLFFLIFTYFPLSCFASFSRQTLPNGMVIIVKEDRTSDVVSLKVVLRSGSIYEAGRLGSGVSHFVEHMLFKGTPARGVGEIEREVRRLGGEINGWTNADANGYGIVVPSENFQKAVDIMKDALMNPLFDKEEFLKEQEVILNEMRMNRDNPARRLSRLLWGNAYIRHPYRLPVIGDEELFLDLKREDLIEFYQRMYVPNNIVFVTAGDVEPKAALEYLKEAFKDFERGNLPMLSISKEPAQIAPRYIEERDELGIGRLAMGFHSTALMDKDLYAMDVLAEILGGLQSSRLRQRLYDEERLVYSVGAANYTPEFPGLFNIYCTLDEENLSKALKSIHSEIEKIKQRGPNKKELKMAKSSVRSALLFSKESVESLAGSLAFGELFAGEPDFDSIYLEGIEGVDEEDIKRVARKYLARENMTVVTLLPFSTEEVLKESEVLRESPKVVKRVLANGMALLTRREEELPIVHIQATFRGGVRMEKEDNNGISRMLSSILITGTERMDKEEIQEALDIRGAGISTFSGNNSFGITMSLLKEDTEFGLGLLYDIIACPAFDKQEIEKQKSLMQAGIRRKKENVFATAFRLLRKTLFTEHPYRLDPAGSIEAIGKMDKAVLAGFYEKVRRPKNMVLSVFGDIEPERIAELAERNFGRLNRVEGQQGFEIVQEPLQKSVRRAQEVMQGKEQSVIMVGFHGIDVASKDRYGFEVLTAILSGGGGRIFERIREESGQAYTLGAFSVLGVDPGFYVLYAATSPEKKGEVEKKLFDIIEELQSEGVTIEEFERAKNNLIGAKKIALQTNASFAMSASLDELYGLGYDKYKDYEREIEAVTIEDVQRIVNKYLDLKACSVVKVGAS